MQTTMSPVEAWQARFGAEADGLPGGATMRALRAAAMERFATLGLPTKKTPTWEHSSPRVLHDPRTAPAATGKAPTDAVHAAAFSDEAVRLVFVDGRFTPTLSNVGALPEGVHFRSLATAVRDGDAGLGAHVETADALECLNVALVQDGALLTIDAGARAKHPLHLIHVHTQPGTNTTTRHTVRAGEGAEVAVVETWLGAVPDTLTHHVTHIEAAPAARIRHVKVQNEGPAADHKGRVTVSQDRDSHVETFLWSEGGRWSRSGTEVTLRGEGASCSVDGLWLGRGEQVHDCPTRIDHAAPHTTSRELYKGILDDAAHGIFLGNVIVRPDAQKVDSGQTNRNLLLSRKARVDTTPQLEIHADDVKCAHGSTIGHLDADAVFFLRSRGIGRERAELLLTKAFAGEVLDRVGPWGIHTRLERRVEEWFGGGA